jgi:hypothetical protein
VKDSAAAFARIVAGMCAGGDPAFGGTSRPAAASCALPTTGDLHAVSIRDLPQNPPG